VGTIQGVGRIYQQTWVDTYRRLAIVKLSTAKSAVLAADWLNDRVLPVFEEQAVPLRRILTDRGTEYCGSLHHHEYQLYRALEDSEPTQTQPRSPPTHGIGARFQRTLQDEFYQVAFRQKLYTSLEDWQAERDEGLLEDNREPPHSGTPCEGRTPFQTFRETQHWAFQKLLERPFESKEREDLTPLSPATTVVEYVTCVRLSLIFYSCADLRPVLPYDLSILHHRTRLTTRGVCRGDAPPNR
jgi:hypothetical protein